MSIVPVTTLPRELLPQVFLTNKVPTTTLQSDPRVSYAAYIPDAHYAPNNTLLPLLVSIHGTSREHSRHIAAWKSFAETHKCAILAPLFPAMLQGPLDVDGYHYLGQLPPKHAKMMRKPLQAQVAVKPMDGAEFSTAPTVRHDLLLLAMLDEMALRWPGIDTSKVYLSGFSGGGQFVHRFMYLHPERVHAAAVGAPGLATLLNMDAAWPDGVEDLEAIFGKAALLEKLKQVPMLAAVGQLDGESRGAELRSAAGDNRAEGLTRKEALLALAESWRVTGLQVEQVVVPGVGHHMEDIHPVLEEFMTRHITAWWEARATRLET